MKTGEAKARATLEELRTSFRKGRDEVQTRLENANQARGDAWDEAKEGVLAAWDELTEGIERARSELESLSS